MEQGLIFLHPRLLSLCPLPAFSGIRSQQTKQQIEKDAPEFFSPKQPSH